MKHFLFEIQTEDGEEYVLVGAEDRGTAIKEADSLFDGSAVIMYEVTDEEAEASGLDEY